jgi:hypothetical protein
MSYICDGVTADGEEVIVTLTDGAYKAIINRQEVEVPNVRRLRDGGTTILYLANSRQIKLPHSINDPDRTPRLDGERIEQRGTEDEAQ